MLCERDVRGTRLDAALMQLQNAVISLGQYWETEHRRDTFCRQLQKSKPGPPTLSCCRLCYIRDEIATSVVRTSLKGFTFDLSSYLFH